MSNSKERPAIYIESKAWEQIQAGVHFQDLEFQFFGRGYYADEQPDPDSCPGFYVLQEIIIPPQEVTGAFTDNGDGDAAVASFNFILMEAVRLGLPISGWGFWGHSHVNMPTGPSTTDVETMCKFAESWGGRAIGAVFNQKNEVTGFGAGPHPIFPGLRMVHMTSLSVVYETPEPRPYAAQALEWMKANVKRRVASASTTTAAQSLNRFFTDVQEVIRSDVEPTTVFLSTRDWDSITGMPSFESLSEKAWEHYEDAGWKGITPFERKLILPELDTQATSRCIQAETDDDDGVPAGFDDAYWEQYE